MLFKNKTVTFSSNRLRKLGPNRDDFPEKTPETRTGNVDTPGVTQVIDVDEDVMEEQSIRGNLVDPKGEGTVVGVVLKIDPDVLDVQS